MGSKIQDQIACLITCPSSPSSEGGEFPDLHSMIPFDSVGLMESLDSVKLKLVVNGVDLTLSFDIVDSKILAG